MIKSERQRYFEVKNSKYLTLNFAQRKAKFNEDEKRQLENTNIRLKAMHKPPVKSVKDLPDNFEFDDPILKACVDIAADYAKMLKNINYEIATNNTPFLLKYQVK